MFDPMASMLDRMGLLLLLALLGRLLTRSVASRGHRACCWMCCCWLRCCGGAAAGLL